MSSAIWADIANGAHLVVSTSGGKDSDCMSRLLHDRWIQLDPATRGSFSLIHADVKGFEWPQSWAHCQEVADRLNVPLFKVTAVYRDGSEKTMLSEVDRKFANRPDAPPWPSAACRWCTSDLKRGPISKWVRNTFPKDAVVYSAMGIRAEESPARAKKKSLTLRPSCQAPTKNRVVYDWYPIFDLTLEDVWNTLFPCLEGRVSTDGLDELRWHQEYYKRHNKIAAWYKYHPAYVWGNERVSCAFCHLAGDNDLCVAKKHAPDIYDKIIQKEQETGYTYLPKRSLEEVNCG